MLYLIRSFGSGKKSLKVGYTGNPQKRSLQYKIENPFHQVISWREGSLIEEKKIQLYLETYKLKEEFLDEWFKDCSETLTLFHESIEKINKRIWKYRDFLFKKADFLDNGNKRKRLIYEELRMIFGIKKEHKIDIEWKMESNKKVLKNLRNNIDLYF